MEVGNPSPQKNSLSNGVLLGFISPPKLSSGVMGPYWMNCFFFRAGLAVLIGAICLSKCLSCRFHMLAGRVLKLWTLWMKIRTLIIITKSFRYQMELLNLIRLFWGRFFFPYISRIHTAYTGEDSSIVGTNEMFGEVVGPKARLALKHPETFAL